MTGRNAASWTVALLLSGLITTSGIAQEPQLGDLRFPTSARGNVQRQFLTGVKLLHNFEYEEAQEAFRACQKLDPDFALAYWGEAMCWNHPLWGEQDQEAARAVLKRLAGRRRPRADAREQGLLRAVRLLYGKGSKQDRDRRYLNALSDLTLRYPNDHEIAAFRALALLGTRAGNRDFRIYMRAAGWLEDIYAQNPRHPGVLHYLIHCYDDPVHAPLGLRAARTYGKIAENSAHAQHMPSHIFLPLGMWTDVVQSNESAWRAGVQRLARRKLGPADHDIHALHALQWLQYGYLQTGEYGKALKQLLIMADIHARKPTSMTKWYFAMMRTEYVIDAPDWRKATQRIDMRGVELSASASHLFADGLAAIRGDRTGAERARAQMTALREDAERSIKDSAHHHSSYFDGVYASSIRATRVMETQLEALIRLADGESAQAVSRLEDAISAEDRLTAGYGPPLPAKLSHELLAEVLLNLNRPQQAEKHFRLALERAPRRTAALSGLLEALRRQGETSKADAQRTLRELKSTLGDRPAPKGWQELPLGRKQPQ